MSWDSPLVYNARMLSILPASVLDTEKRRQALSFLYAWADADGQAWRVERILLALQRNELDASLFLACWLENEVVGCLVCEVLPGRAASFWPIRVQAGGARIEIEQSLFNYAIGMMQSRGSKFIQTLLQPHDNERPSALLRNGFSWITPVWTMHCALPIPIALPDVHVCMTAWAEADPLQFKHAMASSYVGSLDCPEVNNIRTIDEVCDGCLAGTPDQTRWWLAFHQNEPIGVLIVGDGPAPEIRTLVYLGVVPSARHRGFGRELLSHALRSVSDSGATGLTLLVDERNQPAISLYQRFGFQKTEVRHLYLRAIA